MGTEVIVPQFGSAAETVTILNWCKNEGEQVNRGEVLCEVQTEKAAMEIEAFAEGVLIKRLVEVGSEVETGSVIAYVGQAGETVPELPAQASPAPASDPAPAAPAKVPGAAPPRASRPKATPRARRLAKELGVDLLAIAPVDPPRTVVEDETIRSFGRSTPISADRPARHARPRRAAAPRPPRPPGGEDTPARDAPLPRRAS